MVTEKSRLWSNPPVCRTRSCGSGPPPAIDTPDEDLFAERNEQRLVTRALELARGNQTLAAQMLGITRDGLRYKIRKHGFGQTLAISRC